MLDPQCWIDLAELLPRRARVHFRSELQRCASTRGATPGRKAGEEPATVHIAMLQRR